MKINRSHFVFDRGQRNGILSLLGLIILLIALKFYLANKGVNKDLPRVSSEILALREEIDSLKAARADTATRNMYKFNPNFMTDFKAYTLGLSPAQHDKLQAYRNSGKWINSVADFQKVTGVSDSLLDTFRVQFRFPEWVNKPRNPNSIRKAYSALPEAGKKDLNMATTEELQVVPGIGMVLSERIVSYREKLGGFTAVEQLYAVYGLSTEVVDRVRMQFSVKTPRDMTRYNINSASASDIATIPGISFELAREIWEFVRLRDGVNDLDELTKIEEITPTRLHLIKLYLFVE